MARRRPILPVPSRPKKRAKGFAVYIKNSKSSRKYSQK